MEIPLRYLHHRTDRALVRLLSISRDIVAIPKVPDHRLKRINATEPLQAQYQKYLNEITPIAKDSQLWWKEIVDNTAKVHGSHEEGMRVALTTRLAGMSANEFFVSCIRKHWMAFTKINSTLSFDERVPPEDPLLRWPYEEELEDVFQVVITLPYWPVGLDADGNWC